MQKGNITCVSEKALKRADVVILAHDVYKNDIRDPSGASRLYKWTSTRVCVSRCHLPRHVDGMNFRGKPRAAPGRSMIDAIKSVVRRTNSRGIVLTALESVIGYYTRLGFRAVRSRKRMRQIDCPGYRTENDQDRNIYNDITAEGDTTFMRWCARRAGFKFTQADAKGLERTSLFPRQVSRVVLLNFEPKKRPFIRKILREYVEV